MTLHVPPDNPMVGETTRMVYVMGYSDGWHEGYLHGMRQSEAIARNRQATTVAARIAHLIQKVMP